MVTGAGRIGLWNGRAGTLDFELSLNGPSGDYFDLLTYCADPLRPLTVPQSGGTGFAFQILSMEDFGYTSADIIAIEKLWKLAFSESLTSATKAAAFQFLLWEYIADSTVDLNSGVVKVTDTAVRDQASAWHQQVATATERAILLVLDGRGENRQSFFLEQEGRTLVESPEPATCALLGAGLLGLAWARRRKR